MITFRWSDLRDLTAGIRCVIRTFYYYEDPWLTSGLDVQLLLLHHYPHAARLIDKQHKSTQRDKHCQCSKDPDANLYRTGRKLPILGMFASNTTLQPKKLAVGLAMRYCSPTRELHGSSCWSRRLFRRWKLRSGRPIQFLPLLEDQRVCYCCGGTCALQNFH